MEERWIESHEQKAMKTTSCKIMISSRKAEVFVDMFSMQTISVINISDNDIITYRACRFQLAESGNRHFSMLIDNTEI